MRKKFIKKNFIRKRISNALSKFYSLGKWAFFDRGNFEYLIYPCMAFRQGAPGRRRGCPSGCLSRGEGQLGSCPSDWLSWQQPAPLRSGAPSGEPWRWRRRAKTFRVARAEPSRLGAVPQWRGCRRRRSSARGGTDSSPRRGCPQWTGRRWR